MRLYSFAIDLLSKMFHEGHLLLLFGYSQNIILKIYVKVAI